MAAAITSAAIGVAAAGASIYQGAQQKKKASQALNEYERQDLVNAAEQIEISTIGSDLMREESQRTTATMVDALQGGGGRLLGASLPQLQAGINQTNRQIQKDLDDQVINREYAIAQEESRLQNIRENRDVQNIGALSSQYSAGDQNMWNGINGAVAATGSLGRSIDANGTNVDLNRVNQANVSSNITPSGVTYHNPFQNILPPTFQSLDFTKNNMYKNNIV